MSWGTGRVDQRSFFGGARSWAVPEKIGKPLLKDLAGYRSLRAAGQRYRIIYAVQKPKLMVSVMAVGIRKEGDRSDIYSLAKKLVRLALVD